MEKFNNSSFQLTMPEFLSLGERSRRRILEWKGTKLIGPLEHENQKHSLYMVYEFLVETIDSCAGGQVEIRPLKGHSGLSKFLKNIHLEIDKLKLSVEEDPPDGTAINAPP